MTTKINLTEILDTLGPQFAARSAELDATDGFIAENYAAMKEAGLMTALIPMEYGGGGATYSEMCEFIRGMAHHCSSTALALSMHQHLVSAAVANDRAGRPGRPLLDKVVAGNLQLISTGANDWLGSNGSAMRVEGGYRVTAVKPFASGSPSGNVLVTSCAYDDPVDGPIVMHFPVPTKAEGVEIMNDWQTMGMRATGSQTVRLTNVFVPDEAIALRRPRGGYHPAFSVILTVAMPVIMSAYLGAAEAAAAIARNKATARRDDPIVAIQTGEMETLLTTAQIARDDMVRMCNDFDFVPSAELASQILTRKTICAKHVMACAEKALELAGGSGFYRKTGLERLLRDVHGSQFHPLPEKRQHSFTGRLTLGLEPVEVPMDEPARSAA